MDTVPEDIIVKFLQHTASGEETERLNQWLKEHEDHSVLFYRMQEIMDSSHRMNREDIVRSWDKLYGRISHVMPESPVAGKYPPSLLPSRFRQWIRYAAAIMIGFAVAWHVWKHPSESVIYNMVYNRQGTQKLTLPDSSVVWLGSNSNIGYPEHFRTDRRQVTLTGKAYFDVQKNSEHPFVVQSGNVEVIVTGTEFEMERTDAGSLIVTLVSGAVSVKAENNAGIPAHVRLTPGQQAHVDKSGETIRLKTIDPEYYAAWKDGSYRFTNETIEKIAEQLAKHYRVKVRIAGSLKGKRFTGRVMPDQQIEEVMKNIGASHPVKYRITAEGIFISEK
ncbi:MAG: FecR domain-containing protein [Bacteroidales bacterium]|jgi:ferric-dicitrate binding protein FerR (iron transport regulator)|nr:FecR domain-containing protein [Bacteroidales bacterium]